MVAFIALFLPAILMACIWLRDERIDGKPSWNDIRKRVVVYALSVLLLNFLDLLVLAVLHKVDGNLALKLNSYGSFAMKYILLSAFIGIALPIGVRAIKKGMLTFKVNVSTISKPNIVVNVALVAYAIVLFFLNFIRIFDHNFWGDESFSANLVRNPIPQILQTTANDVHPPLYYMILRAAYLLLGDHGFTYHIVSLIPFVIILVFCLTRVRKEFGTGVALFLMTMASLSSNALTYNVEVRMYSWAAMFVLFSYYELHQVFQTNKGQSYFWFAIFSIGAAYSHYYALVAVAFFYIVLLVWSFLQGKKCLIKALVVSICTAFAYLPWLGVLLRAFARKSESFWLTSIPTVGECVRYLFSNQFPPAVLAVFAIAMMWVALCGTHVLDVEKNEDGRGTVVSLDVSRFRISGEFVWGIAGIVSIAGTIAVGLGVSIVFRPLLVLRYIYPVSVVAWLLVGVAISRVRIGKTRLGNLCMAIMLAYMLVLFLPAYKDKYVQEKASNDTLNATLAAVGDGITDESMIITDNGHVNWTIAHYYFPEAECRLLGDGVYGTLEPNSDYWLFLSKEVDDELVQDLLREGYYYKEIKKDGILGTSRVFVYHLTPVWAD